MTEEKRKKRRKKKTVILLAGIAAACGIYGVWRIQAVADTDTGTAAVSVSAGEEVIYGQLTAVRGNEITYVTAEETGSSAGSQEAEETRRQDTGSGEGKPDRSEKGGGRNEAVSGGDAIFQGEMPVEGSFNMGSETTSGMPDLGDMPPEGSSGSQAFIYDNRVFQLTGEECTELVPVGTPVTTKLGTVTTFSRLAAGDNIAIVRNRTTGEIMAVYIIG